MLKQRFLVQFGTQAIIHIVGMVAGIIVARLAGPSVVGVISYGTAYVSLLAFIVGLFGSPHIKLASEGRDHAACLGVYSRLVTISAIVYFLATLGMFLTQKYLLNYQFESREVQIVIIITLIANVVHIYESYGSVIYTANLKQAKANIPYFFRTLFYHIGRVVIVLLGYRAIAIAGWKLFLMILVVPFIHRLLRQYPIGKYNAQLAKEYFRYTIPILIIVVVDSVTHYADKLFLAHYTNTTQLGYYSAAHSIGGMFMLIAGPVGTIFFPLFSGMIAKGNWVGVNRNIRKYQEFIVLFVFPLICALAIAGGPVLLLVLGNRYQPSVDPFIIIVFATYILLWGMPYGNIISAMGKFYLSAWINITKLVVFALSITIFVSPKFLNLGATGVAFNLLVMNLIGNGLYIYLAKKHGDIQVNAKNHLRHAIIILTTIGGYFAASHIKQLWNLWWLAFIPLFILILYVVLIICGMIKKEHWDILLEALNFKKTIIYVNNEMRE